MRRCLCVCIAKRWRKRCDTMMRTWLSGRNCLRRISTVKFGYLLRANHRYIMFGHWKHSVFGPCWADSRSQLDRLNYRDCWRIYFVFVLITNEGRFDAEMYAAEMIVVWFGFVYCVCDQTRVEWSFLCSEYCFIEEN